MNEFGNFLYELRKEKGMTQIELAEKLGVTNKAVSKWETGEAMPETGQLLPIAEIFGVSADELLSGKRKEREAETTDRDGEIPDEIKRHLFTRGKDDEKTLSDKICGAVCASVVLIGTAVYLFMGVLAGLWDPYWIIVPTCALADGIIGIFFELFNREKRERRMARGENVYAACACGLIMLSCIIVYLYLGAFTGLWHPLWIIVVAGALADGVIGAVGEITAHKEK